ncbi:MAG TPA: L-threonylcarbamoyladenylate synthase [Polyangiaceae bacterium]|nr:L-threonylcarbamoyladenylate synthase [Polyangiaceae bacterium]
MTGAEPFQTEVLAAFADPSGRVPGEPALARAAGWLARSVPVVMPTETVYGLAAPVLDRAAVEAVFAIKRRPLDNPLIAHVAELGQLALLGARLTGLAARLADAFWPGPLTLVLPTDAELPWVTAGLDSIAVRQPRHEFALALICRAGPLAAPSANLSGLPSPTRAAHAVQDLSGLVPLIIDGGELAHGLESTVIDARGEQPVLLRPGALSAEEVEACCGRALATPESHSAIRSPGMKYRHYSPRAELWLYPALSAQPAAAAQLFADARELRARGQRVAVIASRRVEADHFIELPGDPEQMARQLFRWLRELDERGAHYVLIETVSRSGIGRAIMDRLERAATRVRRAEPASAPLEAP